MTCFKRKEALPPPRKKTLAVIGTVGFLAAAGGIGAPMTLEKEGMKLKPYYDSVGVKTWCVGETEIGYKESFTENECKRLFGMRHGFYSQSTVMMYNETGKANVTPEMHAAFTDMSYNVGIGAVKKSSMIRLVNEGKPRAACDAILLYKRAGKFKDCSKTKGMKNGCYGVWQRRLTMHKLCLKGLPNED